MISSDGRYIKIHPLHDNAWQALLCLSPGAWAQAAANSKSSTTTTRVGNLLVFMVSMILMLLN